MPITTAEIFDSRTSPASVVRPRASAYDRITGLLGGSNMAAVHLANATGGSLFLGFIYEGQDVEVGDEAGGVEHRLAGGLGVRHREEPHQDSYNNINDTDAAYEAVSEFDPARTAAVVIVKHANPYDHFREDLDDLLRGFRVQRAVERDDAAERRDRIAATTSTTPTPPTRR
jgi:hypothetical protein